MKHQIGDPREKWTNLAPSEAAKLTDEMGRTVEALQAGRVGVAQEHAAGSIDVTNGGSENQFAIIPPVVVMNHDQRYGGVPVVHNNAVQVSKKHH